MPRASETEAMSSDGAPTIGPVPTRRDVSMVTPQGAYVPSRCPVRAQWDLLYPCEPLPPSPVAERRIERGRSFESAILSKLASLHPDAVVLRDMPRPEQELATVAAMQQGAPMVLGGRLPTDLAGRRAGGPDVLVRDEDPLLYRAIDVKGHHTHDEGLGGIEATCSPLVFPGTEATEARRGRWARKRRADMLQLAHYQRMLEAAGFAPPGPRRGDHWARRGSRLV